MSRLTLNAGRSTTIDSYPLQGSDDRLVRVAHDDGQFIIFRDPQLTTWDVSSGYGDWGHDSFDDRAAAARYIR